MIKSFQRVLLLSIFVFAYQIAVAQFKEEFFDDHESAASEVTDAIKNGSFIYSCGTSIEVIGNTPVVRKLDQDGVPIWENMSLGFSGDEYLPVYLMRSGSNLFVISQSVWGSSGSGVQLSCLDEVSGTTLYSKQFNTDGNFRITDYNASELLAYYPANGQLHHMARISKQTGDVLSITPTIGGNPTAGFAVIPSTGVYFAIRDTIYRHHYTNLSQKLWSMKVNFPGNDPVNAFNRLVENISENAIYAFGMSVNSKKICVAKINATTGAVLWTFRSDNAVEYAPGPIQFVGNDLYISWRHIYVGGGAYQIGVSKINTQTGVKVWESGNEQIPNNYNEQSGLAMEVHNDMVYLTGYYDAENYGPGKWGVMALDAADGTVRFRKQVPPSAGVVPTNEKLSTGVAVFVKGDRIVVLGNSENVNTNTWNTWIEMNGQSGDILLRKIYGGASLYPARVKDLVQLPSGKFVSLIQQGRNTIVRQTDAKGTQLWELSLTAEFGLVPEQMVQVRGDSIVVAGFSYPDVDGFQSFGHAPKNLRLYLINGSGILLKSITRSWPAENAMVTQLLRDKQSENYYLAFQAGNQYKVAKFNFSGWVSESAPLDGSYDVFYAERQIMCISNTSNELYYFSKGVYSFDLASWPNFTYYPNGYTYGYESILQRGSQIFAGGSGSSPAKPILWRYTGTQQQQMFVVDDMPSLQSFGDIVQGENPSIVYLLAEGYFSRTRLYKFNIDTWSVVWSSPVFEQDDILGVRNYELVFNAHSNTVAVCGSIVPDDASGWKGYLKTFDGNAGQLIMETYKDTYSDFDDEYTDAIADRNSSTLIAGGFLWQNSILPVQGFLQYHDLDEFNKIHVVLYWDVNENAQYEPAGDFRINQGRLYVDDGDYFYFNDFGEITATVLPGSHYVELDEVLPGWELTTASTSAYLSTIPYPSDTFFIGLKRVGPVPASEVSASLTGQHFVCGDTAVVNFKLKSSSLNFTNVHIFLVHPGGYISADIPEEQTSGDTLFWNGPGMIPFGNWPNELRFKMPDVASEGDSLDFELFGLVYDGSHFEPVDTLHVFFRDALKCSFDPNDKIAMPAGVGEQGKIRMETPLTYTIRFQNTGNYLARHIVIRDTLDADIDPETFEFLGASHPITDIRKQDNILEFTFRNINLPESASDYFGSQGFVQFSVKPRQGLPEGTAIHNRAAIYFDFNPAVITNTTINTYVTDLASAVYNPADNPLLQVWPNPSSGVFHVEFPFFEQHETTLRLTDASGKTQKQEQVEPGETTFELECSGLPSGFYFLQVISEGKMLAVKKLIKLKE